MKMEKMLHRTLKEVSTDRFVIEMNMPKEYPPIKARPTEEGGVRDRFFAAKAELPDEITVIRPFCTDAFPLSNACTVYVAPDGDDSGDGSAEKPLATLAAAADAVKGKGGAKIVLRGGCYQVDQPVTLGAEHSGKESSPLIIKSENGETAELSASRKIPVSLFAPLTDEKMLARLSPAVRGKVLVADLSSLGIKDYGTVNIGGTELLINGIKRQLCRYPNEGEREIWMEEGCVICPGGPEAGTGNDEEPWEMKISDDRFKNWEQTGEIRVFGSLCVEWERHCTPVGSFDPEKMTMRGTGRYQKYLPVKYNYGNSFFFCNVFEELDAPGEWYLDRASDLLYLFPPEDCDFASADIRLITTASDILHIEGAENIIIDRLDIGRCAGVAISVQDCRQVLIQRCHIVGTCPAAAGGGYEEAAVKIGDGFRNGVICSKFEYFAAKAALIFGGDRRELIPANNFFQNNVLDNPLCRFGTSSGGCGNVLSHNFYHNTTIEDSGHNEGIIEYNVIEGGDTVAHDTGMIYVGGGGCSSCANHYRYNYFFDFVEGDYGVYFDDLSRGMYAYGNIVVGNGTTGDGTTWYSGGRSFNHHNGGGHCFFNNISIDAGYFAFGGDVSYWNSDDAWNGLFGGILGAAKNMYTEKYIGRNPTYGDYCRAVFQYAEDKKQPGYVVKSGAAERRLRKPWCNNYENNVIIRAARPFKLDNGVETATCIDTNFITDDDPGFVDFEGCDYRFKPDAAVYDKIPDFVPPPFEKMGPVDE